MKRVKMDTSSPSEVWYRFSERATSITVDPEFDVYRTEHSVELTSYPVAKHTPCGVRLSTGRLVLHNSQKKWACATVDEAKTSFLARKNRQIRILSRQLENAENSKKMVEAGIYTEVES